MQRRPIILLVLIVLIELAASAYFWHTPQTLCRVLPQCAANPISCSAACVQINAANRFLIPMLTLAAITILAGSIWTYRKNIDTII